MRANTRAPRGIRAVGLELAQHLARCADASRHYDKISVSWWPSRVRLRVRVFVRAVQAYVFARAVHACDTSVHDWNASV